MLVGSKLPGYRWFHVFRNAAIRTGVYTGVCLTLVFVALLINANHASFLERFALERNIAAAAVLCFLAAVPVLRFFRLPGNLLASSLIGWIIFSFSYRILCFVYRGLNDWRSPFYVFMTGSFAYLILTTLSWIGTMIRRARAADPAHPDRHQVDHE